MSAEGTKAEGSSLITGGDSDGEVSRWLSTKVGLPQYAAAFKYMGFTTLELVCEIESTTVLQDVGIAVQPQETAHRLKIMNAIRVLQQSQDATAPSH